MKLFRDNVQVKGAAVAAYISYMLETDTKFLVFGHHKARELLAPCVLRALCMPRMHAGD